MPRNVSTIETPGGDSNYIEKMSSGNNNINNNKDSNNNKDNNNNNNIMSSFHLILLRVLSCPRPPRLVSPPRDLTTEHSQPFELLGYFVDRVEK